MLPNVAVGNAPVVEVAPKTGVYFQKCSDKIAQRYHAVIGQFEGFIHFGQRFGRVALKVPERVVEVKK